MRLSIPDIEQLSTSKELDKLLSDGELDSDDKSDDDILKDLKSVFKGSKKSGLAIDKGLAEVVNEGLRSVGQSEKVKKLREKFIRPSNVDNFACSKNRTNHKAYHFRQRKGIKCSCTDSSVQIYARVNCDCSAIGAY